MFERNEMYSRDSVIKAVEAHTSEMLGNDNLEMAIQKHFSMLFKIYIKSPIYFKMLFKANRFIVGMVILSKYYVSKTAPLLSDLKDHCAGMNILSKNTIESFIFTLRVSGRLEVNAEKDNKRRLNYQPTKKSLQETKELLLTMTAPYEILFPRSGIIEKTGEDTFIECFFKKYSRIVFLEIFSGDLVPDAHHLISKDAGHMIMYYLLNEKIKQQSSTISFNYLKASITCGVSRSHLKRCFRSCEEAGLLKIDEKKNTLRLNDSYISMAKHYFAFYLATLSYGFSEIIDPLII